MIRTAQETLSAFVTRRASLRMLVYAWPVTLSIVTRIALNAYHILVSHLDAVGMSLQRQSDAPIGVCRESYENGFEHAVTAVRVKSWPSSNV